MITSEKNNRSKGKRKNLFMENNLEDFVTETTIYEIVCSECGSRTQESSCEEDVVTEAEQLGFEVIDNLVYCPNCA